MRHPTLEQMTKLEMGVRRLVNRIFPDQKGWKFDFRQSDETKGLIIVFGPYPEKNLGQCKGMTIRGRRCRLEALSASPYCAVHERTRKDGN